MNDAAAPAPPTEVSMRVVPTTDDANPIGDAWSTGRRLAATEVPLALAGLHAALEVGAPIRLAVAPAVGTDDAEANGRAGAADDGRAEADAPWWGWVVDVARGAGFELDGDLADDPTAGAERGAPPLHLRRGRTLADSVGPQMRLLVVGLNPSLYAADVGVGFARPGNRFWPAALAAGLVERDRDPADALARCGVGMTDLVKRATARADELGREEYRQGLGRLDRICAWLRPERVCVVGLSGWRAAADRRAGSGWHPRGVGGRPVYVMPNPSGLNASSTLADLVAHLREAATGTPPSAAPSPTALTRDR